MRFLGYDSLKTNQKERKVAEMSRNKKIMMLRGAMAIATFLVLYPFWWLFVRLFNIFGGKWLRNRKNRLETPIIFYEHPDTKKRVALVGTIHIAEPGYFTAIQQRIDSLDGYAVLFEGVGKMSPQEEELLSGKERKIADMLKQILAVMDKISALTSLQHQRAGLSYNPPWINTDFSFYKLVQSLAAQDVKLIDFSDFDKIFSDERSRLLVECLINWSFSQLAALSMLMAAFRINGRTEKVILRDRNEVAFQGITNSLSSGNVVSIWGAAHLKGIAAKLKKIGFEEVGCEWFVVYHKKNYYRLKDLLAAQVSAPPL